MRSWIIVAGAVVVVAAGSCGRAGWATPFGAVTAQSSAVSIAAGLGHTCALTRAGGVECWGYNGHDELGYGGTRDSSTPVGVLGLSAGIKAIAAGLRHSCALTSAGGVKCWGASYGGALGDGTASRRFTPIDVSGLTGVAAIAAGEDHSCALATTGGVSCWGRNGNGELGDETTDNRWSPVAVRGLAGGVSAIAAGGYDTCALTTTGAVKCWGRGYGATPVDVPGLDSGVAAIAVNSIHSCALTISGGVKCWGRNDHGELGDGTTSDRARPVDVVGLASGVVAIAVGTADSCALTGTGAVKCWGLNQYGELGDGTTADRPTPVNVVDLKRGVAAIATGGFHACAALRSGAIKCWGSNGAGQLGDGSTRGRSTPVRVVGFGATASVAIVSRSVPVTKARIASVVLRCGAEARCRGTIALSTTIPLGSRSFSISAGRTRSIAVKLTSRGFELLARVKRLLARVRITYSQPDGGATTAARTLTLTAPR